MNSYSQNNIEGHIIVQMYNQGQLYQKHTQNQHNYMYIAVILVNKILTFNSLYPFSEKRKFRGAFFLQMGSIAKLEMQKQNGHQAFVQTKLREFFTQLAS